MIDLFKETVGHLENALARLEHLQDPPIFIDDPVYPRFRHHDKSSGTAIFLKGVRIVSALNASVALLEKGFVQELGVLFRTIDEFLEDIIFLLGRQPDGNPSDAQRRFLEDFYQEEFDTGKSPLSSAQKRNRVPRSTVYTALARLTRIFVNPSDGREIHRTLSQAMSGYVHGAYPHIMEIYGGSPAHYHLNGMLGTPIYDSCLNQSKHYFYRGIQAAMFLSQAFGEEELLKELYALRGNFEKRVGLKQGGDVAQMVKALKDG